MALKKTLNWTDELVRKRIFVCMTAATQILVDQS